MIAESGTCGSVRHSLFAAGAVGVLWATAGHAGAVELSKIAERRATVCLAWDSGVGNDCPSVGEVAASLREMLGHAVVSEVTCDTRVTGAIRPGARGGWMADLHFASPAGEPLGDRSLEIPDAACSALKNPVSLVIALMVEGNGAESTDLHLYHPLPSAPANEPAHGNATSVSVGGAVSSGLLPNVAWGAGLGLASRAIRGVPLRLDTTFWFPPASPAAGPSGELWAWLGQVGLCPSLLRTRRLGVSACAWLVAGVIHGVGLGLDEVEHVTRPFGAGELSGDLLLRLSTHLSIYLSLGMAAPWLRSRFVYLGSDGAPVIVHEPHLLIPVAGLGILFGSQELRARGAEQ